MKSKFKYIIILAAFLASCAHSSRQEAMEHLYKVTEHLGSKDSSFEFSIAEPKENFMTELWVSDPECTECKDCYVDSGEVKVPNVLKRFIKWPSDFFLTGNNPYVIENTYYVRYLIKGRIVGVKYERPLFWVDSYKQIEREGTYQVK